MEIARVVNLINLTNTEMDKRNQDHKKMTSDPKKSEVKMGKDSKNPPKKADAKKK